MDYQVILTPLAIEQIQQTMAYITQTLQAPETAQRWAQLLRSEIQGLSFLPFRFPLTSEEPWCSRGVRKMTVKNFLVYYIVDEAQSLVTVTAVIYGRRDQIDALRML